MGDVFKNCIQYCRIVWYCEKGEKGKDLTRSFMMCSAQASVRYNSVLAVAAFIRAARPPIPWFSFQAGPQISLYPFIHIASQGRE